MAWQFAQPETGVLEVAQGGRYSSRLARLEALAGGRDDPPHRVHASGPLIQARWLSLERKFESAVISVVPAASATAT
jgi:hypothetical protein